MELQDLYKLYLQHPSIKTDTRKIKEGDIFFALKGPNFNGNHYATAALHAGAAYVVIDEEPTGKDERMIRVTDVLITLQQLANHHRRQFKIPFLAITGSNGKTTTKELIHQVLSTTYKTYTTEGNLNNHIGVPVTILSIRNDAEMAVIEMGANHQREIAGYCVYTDPTHGLITNIGKAHLEGFGGIEGVKKGKGELFEYLKDNQGTAFVNNDDPHIKEIGYRLPHTSYGTKEGRITGTSVSSNSFLQVEISSGANIGIIKTQLVGEYNLMNVLAAVTVGKYFSVDDKKIRAAIENYHPSNSRSQLITKGSNKIILDAYNANPASMKVAIENFANMEGNNKILLLGSMMELGEESEKEHNEIVKLISRYHWNNVVLVGDNFKNTSHSFLQFANASAAGEWLKKQGLENSSLLIKGSRSMQMEKVLDAF